MSSATRHRGSEGFTLVEILLAVGITAFIMATVGSTFVGILQAREEVRALADSTSAGPRILTLIERDLQGLWHHNIKDNKVYLGRDNDFNGAPIDRMDFLTSTDAISAVLDVNNRVQNPSVCEVGYWLKDSDRYPGEFRELWRREEAGVDGDLTTGGTFQLVHDRIKSLEITYFRSLGAKAEPLHDWDSSKEGALPRRIKIELEIERKVANRNRVSGVEVAEVGDTIKKYTRHIVLDDRFPTILNAGVAMVPILPGPPMAEGGVAAAGAGAGGGGGGGGRGNVPAGETVSQGRFTTQTSSGRSQGAPPGAEGQFTQIGIPSSGTPPSGFNLNQLLQGLGQGQGGSGSSAIFGAGGMFSSGR